MELRMTSCALCTMPLHQDDSKNMPNPDGEGRVHRQCQDEHDQSHGICRPITTQEELEPLERAGSVLTNPGRMVPRFYHDDTPEVATDRCGKCGEEINVSDASTWVNVTVHGKPVHRVHGKCLLAAAPAPTSARARARGLEQELERLAEEEKQRQLRARELHKELEEAKQQAHVEEHEENARGWAAALWLCLENGKAALRSASTLPPRGWNHVDSESEYEFTLFSGETVWMKVKHHVGAKPPEAALKLGWTPLSQYRVDAKGRRTP